MTALNVQIRHSDSIARTPAAQLLLLAQASYPQPYPHTAARLSINDRVLYAVTGSSHVAGLICYEPIGNASEVEWYVKVAFTDTPFREKGVFKRLWEDLRYRAEQYGVKAVTFDLQADNHDGAKVLRKIGAAVTAFRYEVIV